MSEPIRVFVYGTLKKGMSNHRLLENSQFLGAAESITAAYAMWCNGRYPMLVEDGSQKVHGELYVVDDETFRNLDHLEGHPDLYKRKKKLFNIKGVTVEAWVYLYNYGIGKSYEFVKGCNWRSEEATST